MECFFSKGKVQACHERGCFSNEAYGLRPRLAPEFSESLNCLFALLSILREVFFVQFFFLHGAFLPLPNAEAVFSVVVPVEYLHLLTMGHQGTHVSQNLEPTLCGTVLFRPGTGQTSPSGHQCHPEMNYSRRFLEIRCIHWFNTCS